MHKRKSTLRWNEKRVSVRPRRMAKTDSRAAAHGNGYGSLLERARSRLITIIFVLCCTLDAHSAGAQMLTCASEVPPSEPLGELFRNVQLRGIFPDSKTFADLHFDDSPNTILADYPTRSNPALILAHSFVNISRYRQRDQPFTLRRRANRLISTLHGSGTS